LKIKGKNKKMLKMKEPPNNFLKTQRRKGTSQQVDENRADIGVSPLLHDSK
jgi:hypothetical protein